MKILILTDVFFPDTIGGAGRVAYYLCHELSRKGHEIHVVTRNINGALPSHEKFDNNFLVHRFPLPRNESLKLLFEEVRYSYSLVKKISKEITFDLICIHQSMAAIGPIFSGSIRGVPIIYYFHSPWHEEYLIKKRTTNKKLGTQDRLISSIMKKVEKSILLRSNKVIVLSDYMRKKVSQIHGYPQDSIKIIPGGVDLNRFHLPVGGKTIVKQELDLTHDKTIFLTIRNLVPRMGLESLIEAFNCSQVLRKKARLLLGGKGFLETNLKEMVKLANLKDTVNFLGYIPDEDLSKFYQTSDYFILPTKNLEGFGLVILESMACGTPVIGTPVGAIPEVIGAFDGKLVFKGTGWEDLKEKLEEVVNKPDIYDFSQEECRRFVENNYSWDKVGDMFEKEMEKTVGCMQ